MAAVTFCNDFGAQENKVCHCFPVCSPITLWQLDGKTVDTGLSYMAFIILSYVPSMPIFWRAFFFLIIKGNFLFLWYLYRVLVSG